VRRYSGSDTPESAKNGLDLILCAPVGDSRSSFPALNPPNNLAAAASCPCHHRRVGTERQPIAPLVEQSGVGRSLQVEPNAHWIVRPVASADDVFDVGDPTGASKRQ
jgi:hypothetical protein